MDKKCEICGTMMYNVTTRRKYCSKKCAKEAEKAKLRAKTAEKYAQGKICEKCGKTFTPKKYGWNRKYCFECVPEEAYTSGAAVRRNIKKWAVEYKGGECERCGYNKCIEALDFHHKDPNEKDFCISDRNINQNWEEIKKELDKCEMLCANCHREEHVKLKKEE